jgi:hypothetical protein
LHAQDHFLSREIWPFPVTEDGLELRFPFLGGFDAPRPQFADIDGDGDLDLFLQEHTGSLMFFRNDGSPSSPDFLFETDRYQDLDVGQWAVLADLDGDLDLDMISERSFGLIRLYRNEGSLPEPLFVEAVDTLRTNAGELITADATIPVITDVDCDGRIDLMLGRDAGTISRFEWTDADARGNPVFVFVENRYQDIEVIGGVGKRGASGLHGASSVSFTDLDDDGDPDLLWGDFFESNVILFRNEGSCTSPAFVRETDTVMLSEFGPVNTSGYNAPRVVDIDSDSRLDLFVGVLGGAFVSSTSSVENFYRFEELEGAFNLVTSRFMPVIDVGSEASPLVVDLGGNGFLDVLVGNIISPGDPSRASISVFENRGDFHLIDSDAVPFGGYSAVPATTDVDCDGDADLFVGSFDGTISHFSASRSAGRLAWTLETAQYGMIDVGLNSAPTWVDIDADGDDDLFVGEETGVINLFRNVGSACQPALTLETETYAGIDVGRLSRPTFVDYDSDGDPDLFVGSEAGVVRFFRNTGTAADADWQEGESVDLPFPGVATPAPGDFDRDGDPDLIVGVKSGGLLYYRNDRIFGSVGDPASEHDRPLRIGAVYPNPAASELRIDVQVSRPGTLSLQVMDLLGRVVMEYAPGLVASGSRRVDLDVRGLAPGVYLVQMTMRGARAARRFVVIR